MRCNFSYLVPSFFGGGINDFSSQTKRKDISRNFYFPVISIIKLQKRLNVNK